jgi:hypothetical protein
MVVGQNASWIDRVQPTQIRDYFSRRGWVSTNYPRPNVEAFIGPADYRGQPIVLTMPMIQSAPDFRKSVEELIETLSQIEGREPLEILSEILQ